jgi:hypothetical protein
MSVSSIRQPDPWAWHHLEFLRRPFQEYRLRDRILLCQLSLFLVSGFAGILMWVSFQEDIGNLSVVAFLASQLGIMVLCYVVPWERLPYTSYLIIPLLDFISIAPGAQAVRKAWRASACWQFSR